MSRRIVTAREQYEMLSPWLHEAQNDADEWFHLSYEDLPVGSSLLPRSQTGVRSPWADQEDGFDRGRGDHVWVDKSVGPWPHMMRQQSGREEYPNVYRVTPKRKPKLYPGAEDQGWTTPSATISESLGPYVPKQKRSW